MRQRYALADGGASGLFGAGPTCMPVTEGDVLSLRCDADVFLCEASTDGGCSATATDINHGVRLGAGTLRTFVPDTNTSTLLCMSSADGGAANCPVWRHR
ncbi:MAG: hypothetical protein IT371_10005 [Deltaproteobacteria bacterium]|nr:hypothetical protein [Deltaproteobacteria bacterium]